MQSADFLSAVFFYLKEGENLNQNWIVENLNNAFSTWNGKLGELWGLVTTGPQTFKGGAVWSVMQTLHNGMVGIGYALVVLFFAISLCKNTMNFHELKRPEAAIHYFLRFVAAKALVGYGMDIMLNVFSICNGIVTDIFITVPCCLDIPYLLSNNLVEVTGEVTQGAMSGENSNSERRIHIRDEKTGEEHSLKYWGTGSDLGDKITVRYLPHTEYGYVVE